MKKETRKNSNFPTDIESFIQYNFHCYKVQLIFFHLTHNMHKMSSTARALNFYSYELLSFAHAHVIILRDALIYINRTL